MPLFFYELSTSLLAFTDLFTYFELFWIHSNMSDTEKEKPEKDGETKPKFVARSLVEVQRAKLLKLMSNPEKEVVIPALHKRSTNSSAAAPTFVRNVMGSSAGAGSGEFHVYRHLRRKEFARQKQIEQLSRTEQLDLAFEQKLEENRQKADDKTARKRAKRLKKKQKAKHRKKNPNPSNAEEKSSSSDSEESEKSDNEEDAAESKNTDGNEEKQKAVEVDQESEKCTETKNDEKPVEDINKAAE